MRKWISGSLAAVATVLLALTLVWPQWIEDIFNIEPDGGDGSFEVLSAVALAVIAAAAGTDSLVAWLRSRPTTQTNIQPTND